MHMSPMSLPVKSYNEIHNFLKQKTAYEIYQCDWSSDVCSSDLPDPLMRVCPGRAARSQGFQEMRALQQQRLGAVPRDRLAVPPRWLGRTLTPGDPMPIENKLLRPRPSIVEHCHAGIADDDQPLFLVRV